MAPSVGSGCTLLRAQRVVILLLTFRVTPSCSGACDRHGSPPFHSPASARRPWHPRRHPAWRSTFRRARGTLRQCGSGDVELTRLQRAWSRANCSSCRRSWYERSTRTHSRRAAVGNSAAAPRFRSFDLAVQVHALFQRAALVRAARRYDRGSQSQALAEWSTGSARGAVAADAREQHTSTSRHLSRSLTTLRPRSSTTDGIDEQRISVVGGGLDFDELPDRRRCRWSRSSSSSAATGDARAAMCC